MNDETRTRDSRIEDEATAAGVLGEALPAAVAFARLVEIIARLRAPDGCPWDREQTHLTLRKHLIEEAYETLEAIETGDDENFREELGDLILQPVLHAQIAGEEERFDIVDVLNTLSDKLVRRHPHVFGEVQAADSDQVLRNWEAIKKQEKAQKAEPDAAPASILSGVPRALPALSLALDISRKAARAGFEWPDVPAVMDKLHEEVRELEEALSAAETTPGESTQRRVADELGDLLFTAVNVARWQGVDPELALRDMVLRFRARFEHMETLARRQDQELPSLSPEAWEELWRQAKAMPHGESKSVSC